MRSTFFLSLLVAAIVLIHCNLSVAVAAADGIVNATCKRAADVMNYEFCMSSLQAVPESRSADTKGLAIIAAKLTVANAMSTKAKISELLKKPIDNFTHKALEVCLAEYSDVIETMTGAIGAIESSRYHEVRYHFNEAIDSQWKCREMFENLGIKFVLQEEDENCEQLIGISVIINEFLY